MDFIFDLLSLLGWVEVRFGIGVTRLEPSEKATYEPIFIVKKVAYSFRDTFLY